ncbi:MAG TPA: hypothetical protein VKB88_09905 [Bryobacteraceae bacterium]|nr:hypothetical protein [Bryobacteraceae bacterium]
MAGKKKAAEGGSASDDKAPDKTVKKEAAPTEVAVQATPRMKSAKIPKLAKKNKTRLPRRQKKALRKAEAAKGIQTGDRV